MNKYLAIGIIVVAFAASGFLSYSYFNHTVSLQKSLAKYQTPSGGGGELVNAGEPRTEECPTNGELLGKSQKALWDKRRPLGVMIENHTEARPQSGLSSADTVYEAVAEGGITRFLTVFYCKDSVDLVGPVRSARVYFIDLIEGYGENPLYTHVGGANCNKTTGSGCADGAPADALGKLEDLGWFGYNDLNFPSFPVMWRDYERLPNVATEHTVYSTTKKLWDYAAKKFDLTNVDSDGKSWDTSFEPWKFKADKPSATPTASTITFDFWKTMPDYSVKWVYNKVTNTYKRFNGGQPHIDRNTKNQIETKNVIIAFAKESEADDGYDAGQHMLYGVVGTNDAMVFMDGTVVKGTWEKKKETDMMRFFDENGKEIALNRGQDFVEIVPQGNDIVYK